ncbi:amidohydrolase family protein [Chitinophaga agrisoli]|uniref:Amidohydrolase family protein n=1 Tax=Chitinophaga agrisoli TaxID=2607653 RepID=A0A5B2W1V9_9BACT|nr:amidohydrolase family protein [Chitinophaga agrisoli]KAA2244662.1 amidohydrolase family protein [Chitinophaga agrisoli]
MTQPIKLSGKDLFNGRQLLGPDKVLILDKSGRVADIVDKNEAGGDIQELDGILSPGFVNTHCHLELSHMKGMIPEKTGLPAFLTAVMTRRGAPSPDTDAQLAAAETAMWEQGISAVGDICNGTATLPQKQQGRLYYHSFIECMGFIDAAAGQRFEQSLAVYRQFQETISPQHRCSLAPHAPYSVSATLFGLLAGLENNTPLTIHNQESEAENILYRQKTGPFLEFYEHFGMDISGFSAGHASSLQACLPYLSGSPLLLVHNTFSAEADMLAAQERALPVYWCLCPLANLYIEDRLPDIDLLRRTGCTVALGTDSLASNHQLSIWAEIQAIRERYPEIPLAELLQWATFNGAQALGIGDRYGSFEQGMQPGVVVIGEAGVTRVV